MQLSRLDKPSAQILTASYEHIMLKQAETKRVFNNKDVLCVYGH